ncbi:H-NS histone family protein [Escherichia coli]|uniref:H-NS histone family protein n=1 Tax=Escherichia coli TaxID=562 RepID=UPI0018161362|nr:H-NS family nucleoid-associated regulatory protein [Escherichia coli]EFA3138587.1 H-NS histone family protein [Escherichia coli]EFF7464551.1 H-NS histone family protein [Escherichia coli]EFG1603256.1 H-NS histone family protein [Escherichia coli]EFK6292273.1 H-NS histone family protein [Escherichia coli]EFU5669609.1 H-NS histone family protein [Escherichia coli]
MNMENNSHTTSPYIQLIEQIAVLQQEAKRLREQEAKRLREQEVQSVIESIQKQITYYNITLQELGYTNVPDDGLARRNSSKGVYYRNEEGQTWSGVGRQPRWLKEALLNGMKKEDFLVKDTEEEIIPLKNI